MCEIYFECPKCHDKDNLLRIGEDGEEQLYSCESCGWERIVYRPFDVGSWSIQLLQALAPIDVLESVLTDQDLVKVLRPRLKGMSHLSSPIPNFDLGDEYYQGEVEDANQVYRSQMVVLAVTYAEVICKNFYYCLYLDQPKRMNQVLSDERGKATVTLNRVIDASSKYELLNGLAQEAAATTICEEKDRWCSLQNHQGVQICL